MKALILSGGKSSRMGSDKASLTLGGLSLLERSIALLRPVTDDIHLSVAHGDSSEKTLPVIADLEPSPGPLGGLQAAFKSDPTATWLLIACDLPLLTEGDISALTDAHDPSLDVTCFLNPFDDHPEPLCAIYSPTAAAPLDQIIAENRRCARRFIRSLKRTELTPTGPQSLLNLNRPEMLRELELLHENGPVEKTITIEYFAKLSEEAGTISEEITTSAATLAGLWEEVRMKHQFTLDLPHIKPALNNEFADWSTSLTSGQTIALMPPFAGG